MPARRLLAALLVPFLAGAGSGAAPPPQRLALLVGVGAYPRPWPALSVQDDLAALRQLLIERFGFPPADILVLADGQATRQAILEAFTGHLIDRARPGDTVVFYFAGHGQQVPDNDGDEADGLDEVLLPIDAPGRGAVRDDHIQALLAQLRHRMQGDQGRVTGHIALFLDTCFAGGATRGPVAVRGLPPAGPPAANPSGRPDSGLLASGEATDRSYLLFAAAQGDQPAQEWQEPGYRGGLFTVSLVRALRRSTPQTSYRALYDQVSAEMAARDRGVPAQEPYLEGDLDGQVLSGAALPRASSLAVLAVEADRVTLPAGALHGTTAGSRFALYPADSDVTDERGRVAEAEVVEVRATTCTARLLPPARPAGEVLRTARAVEIMHRYGPQRLRVRVEEPGPRLPPLEMIAPAGAAPADVRIRRKGSALRVERASGAVLLEAPALPAGRLREVLLTEWRWQQLLRLPDGGLPGGILLRLVPVSVRKDGAGRVVAVTADRPDLGLPPRLRPGDHFVIELRNASPSDLHVTVFALNPDGSISQMLPLPDVLGGQDRVPADGRWHRVRQPFVVRADGPEAYGRTFVKAIATLAPTDLGPGLSSPRGVGTPRPGLLQQLLWGRALRVRAPSRTPPDQWSTATAVLVVTPP